MDVASWLNSSLLGLAIQYQVYETFDKVTIKYMT